jgi:hypothetical protein
MVKLTCTSIDRELSDSTINTPFWRFHTHYISPVCSRSLLSTQKCQALPNLPIITLKDTMTPSPNPTHLAQRKQTQYSSCPISAPTCKSSTSAVGKSISFSTRVRRPSCCHFRLFPPLSSSIAQQYLRFGYHVLSHFRPGTINAGFTRYVPIGSVKGVDISEVVISQARFHAESQNLNNTTFTQPTFYPGKDYPSPTPPLT